MIAEPAISAPALPSSPSLGVAEGHCRPGEAGPAVIVTVLGLKDDGGRIRVEVYPAVDGDFLADDNILVAAGKAFRRAEIEPSATVPAQLCVRLPAPGKYALAVIHDRNSDHKFGPMSDGIGFAGDPKLGWSKPKATAAEFSATAGITSLSVTLNYRRGLTSMAPLKRSTR